MAVVDLRPPPRTTAAAATVLLALLWLPTLAADSELVAPQLVIRQLSEEARAVVRHEGLRLEREPQRLRYWVEQIIFPRVDFEAMARLVIGKNWRRANADQRERFIKEFRALLVNTYAAAYRAFGGWELTFLPLDEANSLRTIDVPTKIVLVGGPAAAVTFRMVRRDEVWKIFDITIEGISLVNNFRTAFAREVSQGGVENLVRRLETHNAKGDATTGDSTSGD